MQREKLLPLEDYPFVLQLIYQKGLQIRRGKINSLGIIFHVTSSKHML